MNDVYSRIIDHMISVWRRRWYVVAIAWFFCGAGWTLVASLPDKFESSARIYVDMDTMLGPLMKGLAVEMNLLQQIDVVQRTLLSRPNLEKVILMTDMDLKVNTEEEKEVLIDKLRKQITLHQQGRNLFTVGYMDYDPALTKRVVQAVLQIFVEGNVGASRKDMETTRRFLDDQIREYEQQLVQAENRLASFKRKNMGFLPGEENYYERMQRMNDTIKKSEGTLAQARTQRESLRKELKDTPQFIETAGGQGVPGGFGAGPQSDTQVRILELEKTIDNLLSRYTPKHPDVLSMQRRLDDLRKQFDQEQDMANALIEEGAPEGDAPGEPIKNQIPNPIHENLKLKVIQLDSGIAALERRIQTERAELEKWAKFASLVPKVEAELVRLNRDYQIVKRNYEELRSRKESAKIARDLETKAQKVQFRIIDPPKVPLKPAGPNRSLFLSIVLLAGLGIGIGFAFVLAQINTTFTNVNALKAKFTLPVLGSITRITGPKERRRRARDSVGFGLVTASLLFAFGSLQAIEQFGVERLRETFQGLGLA